VSEKFTLFYSGPFSQWHPSKFMVDALKFDCAEQYMMYQKAVLFGDFQTAQKIIRTKNNPRNVKQLGREVSGFREEIWNPMSWLIVRDGSIAKFSQNRDLFDILVATKGTTLVECSPTDKIWGIGRGIKDPLALKRETWNGQNRLGEVLTQVRNVICR
jgi:ribA/ribD-fused uncharacterized protein